MLEANNENYRMQGGKGVEPTRGSNKAHIRGVLEKEFEYSHSSWNEKFYRSEITVARLSGHEDHIPVIARESVLSNYKNVLQKGKQVEVNGQVRTINEYGEDGKSHLKIFLFAESIITYDEAEVINENSIYLEGIICKEPNLRRTPLGRYIAEICLAVHRIYNKSDYVPCIAWGSMARFVGEGMNVGNKIQLSGRFQSREYLKRTSYESMEGEWKTAYEISVMELEPIYDDE